MIRLIIITLLGVERREFHSADLAQSHLNGRKDVIGFRALQVPGKKKEKRA